MRAFFFLILLSSCGAESPLPIPEYTIPGVGGGSYPISTDGYKLCQPGGVICHEDDHCALVEGRSYCCSPCDWREANAVSYDGDPCLIREFAE